MTGLEYEHLIAKYLKRQGYKHVKVTKASGDYGVDIIAYKAGHKYAIQCKYYSGDVSLDAVQEAVAGKAMYNCDRAMVVTNSAFTEAAQQLAKANDVILLSGVRTTGSNASVVSIGALVTALLFSIAVCAGMFAAAFEAISDQLQCGNYRLAVTNIVSVCAVAAFVGVIVYFIVKRHKRRKAKSPLPCSRRRER